MLHTSSKSAVSQEKEIKDVATVLFSSVLWVCKINWLFHPYEMPFISGNAPDLKSTLSKPCIASSAFL